MFFTPKVLQGSFNRYYIVAGRSDLPSGWNIRSENLGGSARLFVRGLDAYDSYWQELLYAHSQVSPRHARQSPQERVAELLEGGRVSAYLVPGPDDLKKLAACAITDKKTGVRYLFLPGNASLILEVSHQRSFNSLKDAESFLQSSQLSDEQSNLLVSFIDHDFAAHLDLRQRLAQALVNGELSVGVAPVCSPAKPNAPVMEHVARSASPASLGPHAEPGYVAAAPTPAPAPAKPENEPAQSLEECEQRLEAAREQLKANGYEPKYTDEQLLNLVSKGELDDRFVVRFMESEYVADTGYLGRKDGHTLKYWSTTFNQLENADSDPKTICGVLGIDYVPQQSYTLLIIDTHGAAAGQATNIVPTHKKLGKFAKAEVADLNPNEVNQVMTSEYNLEYAESMKAFNMAGNDIQHDKHVEEFAVQYFTDPESQSRFVTRARIQKKLGANEHFTGNGTTKCLLPGDNRCGVMETFTYDKNPQTLGTLLANGSLKLKPTTPV